MRIYNNKNKIWTVVADQWRPKYVVPGQRRKKKRDITDSTIDVGKFFGMLEKSTYTMQSIINKCYSFQFSFSFFFFLIPIGFWRFFVLPGTCRIEYNTRSILRCRIFYDDGSSACWSHSSWCDFGLTDSDPTTGKHLFFFFFLPLWITCVAFVLQIVKPIKLEKMPSLFAIVLIREPYQNGLNFLDESSYDF